ncbi:hypothetical protein [Paucibacter sp. XJ19-41]|uniref:hypothetical protein n=1 Tax=Paucibacter sp. XJ19-41 TaxID=2927824 RepID=UPI00234A619F|nr:hypothetical protein [Paucibacter sp. XJ19-41]MDC6171072.1 hypothetical protein [Paucibacter sp. XJ19-41]
MTSKTPYSPRSQRGVASVLFMMLLGLGLAGLVFGAVYAVSGSQSQTRTVHAQTQAQLKAWGGAEALRQYLYQLGAAKSAELEADSAVAFTGLDGVSAGIRAVSAADPDCEGATKVAAQVTGSSGGANALLALVYCASGKPGGGGSSGSDAINIKGNLDLSGDLQVLGDDKARLIVDGKVSGAGSLNGINHLYAADSVTLGGSTSIATVFSEGSITLSGSGSYNKLSAMKDITLKGGVSAGTLMANGAVSLKSNQVVAVSAIGDVQLGGARVSMLKTQGNASGNNARITAEALVQGSYSEESDGAVASGQYGQSLTTPKENKQVSMTRVAGLRVALTALTPTTISSPRIDAYEYRAASNYQFERDADNRTVVTVSQVSGIPDGRYFLAGSGANQDWLCSSASYAAASCVAKICAGHSNYNSCLSYDTVSQTWTLAGTSMAPGVAWFKGNLVAGQGDYANSFIATGDIKTAGNNTTEALNYAGYAKVCNNSLFAGLAPRGYCSSGSAELKPQPLGNIAFAAGGYIGASYSGGRIDLTAANHVYGDVLAGDLLLTGGNTTVHGHVVAARMGNHGGNNAFGASTKIDLRNLPSSFKPGENPLNVGQPASAKLLWSSYR